MSDDYSVVGGNYVARIASWASVSRHLRELLKEVGPGRRGDGAEVYHPLTIAEAFAHHFENAGDLFGRYFPIGCHERDQTIWLVDVASGKVATIYHETHPDNYSDEEWLTPAEWMRRENFV